MTNMKLHSLAHIFFEVASGQEFKEILMTTRGIPQEEQYMFPLGSSKVEVSKVEIYVFYKVL